MLFEMLRRMANYHPELTDDPGITSMEESQVGMSDEDHHDNNDRESLTIERCNDGYWRVRLACIQRDGHAHDGTRIASCTPWFTGTNLDAVVRDVYREATR